MDPLRFRVSVPLRLWTQPASDSPPSPHWAEFLSTAVVRRRISSRTSALSSSVSPEKSHYGTALNRAVARGIGCMDIMPSVWLCWATDEGTMAR